MASLAGAATKAANCCRGLGLGGEGLPLREQELHAMDDWHAAVGKTRADLSIAEAPQPGVGAQLEARGKESVAACIMTRYAELVRRTGLHDRYIEYFAACVLAHFDHGSAHRAPAWLCEHLRRQRSSQHPVQPGTVRLEFHHGQPCASPPAADLAEIIHVAFTQTTTLRPVVGGFWTPRGWHDGQGNGWSITDCSELIFSRSRNPAHGLIITREPQPAPIHDHLAELRRSDWRDVPMPYGLEVLWPYEVPMMSLTEEGIQGLARELRDSGIVTTWLQIDRLVAVHHGRWLMLPYRSVENWPGPLDLIKLFALPPSAIIVRFTTPVPFADDGSGARMVVEFETAPPPGTRQVPWDFRQLGEVRPLQPEITSDESLPNDEAAFARAWRLLAQLVAVHPSLRPGRGGPPKRVRVPGMHAHPRVVAGLYRQKLVEFGAEWRRRPDARECHSLWESAKREARRQIAREEREPIPDSIRLAVEREEPWKAGRPPGFNVPSPGE